MKQCLITAILLFFFSTAFSQQGEADDNGMKTYYLVLLKKGPNRTQNPAVAKEIQQGHMAHLDAMASVGKMDLAGPLMEDGDIRGICVYNTATLEEAKSLAESDPAVKAGRLMVEIHPWYAMKGSCLK